MLLKEVMEETGLSKKAIHYYEEQGFVSPMKLENGYRDYDGGCLDTLRYIKQLRDVGLNMEYIRRILLQGEYAPQVYEEVIHKIDEETNVLQRRKLILLDMKDKKQRRIKAPKTQEGHPYIYIQDVGLFFGIFDLVCKGFSMLLFPLLPRIDSIWLPCAILVVLVALVRSACCTYNPYAPRNIQLSWKAVFAFFLGSLVNNMIYMMGVKYSLSANNLYLIIVGGMMVFETYIAFHPFRFIGKEEFMIQQDGDEHLD